MIKRIAAVVFTVSGLCACQSATTAPQQAALVQEDLARLKTERDARRISYTEWAERTGAVARASVAVTPDQEQAIAYRTQLARRVDAGELTPAQFEAESARTLRRLKAGTSRS